MPFSAKPLVFGTAALVLVLAFAAGVFVAERQRPRAASAPPSRAPSSGRASDLRVQLGPRPYYLVEAMRDSALKRTLQACGEGAFTASEFSMGHRGAPLQFPEHTRESYLAAVRMGAGVVECDVTFTRDRQLVCRHDQCDLHRTTDILATPLAEKCTKPPDKASDTPFADVRCCASDLTLAEFETLCGKMDGGDSGASTLDAYLAGTPGWRTDLYATCGTLLSHKESIELLQSLKVKMAPELKRPEVPMPFEGDYTQHAFAQQLIDEYKSAEVPAEDVWPQSFQLEDVRYWIEHEPAFGRHAALLEGRYEQPGFRPERPESFQPGMQELASMGVRVLAAPIWVLLTLEDGELAPSSYARAARASGLSLIAWTLERSGPLAQGGGWYYQSLKSWLRQDGDMFQVLDALARKVGVRGVFSDWPATVTYYANCMDFR